MNLVSHQKIAILILGCALFSQAMNAGESSKKKKNSYFTSFCNVITAIPVVRTFHRERQFQLQQVGEQVMKHKPAKTHKFKHSTLQQQSLCPCDIPEIKTDCSRWPSRHGIEILDLFPRQDNQDAIGQGNQL